ncbi:branched-chain amino acid ABC transporter permease [Alicyclobacillus tolerans]|uniref:branched-chain amino acid ABC transporter permease n=1 Tax=Alicyclobacillus tolerans TaxID=90970 RepID=UPI001F3955C8|nr:branched-chain amino acid ABC transporter permease [Alicyclobacillus tolerans]MCF8566476.1 branched-chain amino acid ABC transporter permease [Alicyclobacillus tolerans]
MFALTIVGGISVGCLYALAALGLVLIFRTSNVVNFAQGEMAMFSAFLAFTVLEHWHLSYWLAALTALVFAFFLGLFVERVFMRRVQKANILSQIILTLSLYLVFRGVAGIIWGFTPTSFPTALSTTPIHIGQAVVTPNNIFIYAVTAVLLAVFYALIHYTKLGLAMRAVSQNMATSQLMGVRVRSVIASTWGIATVLGAIAGILIAPQTLLSPTMMSEVAVKAFAAAVLGGFTSLPGAVIGGLIIGVSENLFGAYVSQAFQTSFVFLLIIVVLYTRPNGLFGKRATKKV